jgi:hypothetical protein
MSVNDILYMALGYEQESEAKKTRTNSGLL